MELGGERLADKIDIHQELGNTGLYRFGGWISEEWLKDLVGKQGIKVYKEMADNDAVIGAVLFAIKMLILQVDTWIEPASDSAADKEAAEFVESCFEDMVHSKYDMIREILSMLTYGWSYHEICYKVRNGYNERRTLSSKYTDGRIGWSKIPIRAQETFFQWSFDDYNELLGMVQISPSKYQTVFIPFDKALLFRTENHKDSPEGRSFLRNAYRSWLFKKNIEEIEGIGIERDLAGIPVATVPTDVMSPDATPEEKSTYNAVKQMVTHIKRNEMEGIVMPAEETPDGQKTGYTLKLLSNGNGKRQFDTSAVITRYEQRMAMSVLADFIMLGHENVGSFALASSKTDIFALAIASILKSILDVFNTYAIPRLIRLNNFPGITDYPKMVHGDIESPDLDQLGTFLTSLAGAGMPLFPNPELEERLLKAANLPYTPNHDAKPMIDQTDNEDLAAALEEVAKALGDDDEQE